MIVFKCKMCGAGLDVLETQSVSTCKFCGSTMALPNLRGQDRAGMYDRANHLRRIGEYDRAMALYERILAEDSTDAEAYWNLVLCKYGIQYVEDPASHRRTPTCNRTQTASIFSDDDYKKATALAGPEAKAVYEAEAQAIDQVNRNILSISEHEAPFDLFICYKETDADGRRTLDSVLAQDLYQQLTQIGYRVFFSRITLEDRLGSEYEPYIFSALNSARIMVVIGTRAEYFNAVWVKNEWSRFLGLMRGGQKKTLIPAYRDMDPYDLPEEFSHLQAQDMGKLGFMQDLLRGIDKIMGTDAPRAAAVPIPDSAAAYNPEALLERAYINLEYGDWAKAQELLEQVLNLDPREPRAYMGRLLAQLQLASERFLAQHSKPLGGYMDFQKALRFADDELRARYEGYNTAIVEQLKGQIYERAKALIEKAHTAEAYGEAASLLESITPYRDAEQLAGQCREKLHEITLQQEARRAAERRGSRKALLIAAPLFVVLLVVLGSSLNSAVQRNQTPLDTLTQLLKAGDYQQAWEMLPAIEHTQENKNELLRACYQIAALAAEDRDLDLAVASVVRAGSPYAHADKEYSSILYEIGVLLMDEARYEDAIVVWNEINWLKAPYKDTQELLTRAHREAADQYLEEKRLHLALRHLAFAPNYSNSYKLSMTLGPQANGLAGGEQFVLMIREQDVALRSVDNHLQRDLDWESAAMAGTNETFFAALLADGSLQIMQETGDGLEAVKRVVGDRKRKITRFYMHPGGNIYAVWSNGTISTVSGEMIYQKTRVEDAVALAWYDEQIYRLSLNGRVYKENRTLSLWHWKNISDLAYGAEHLIGLRFDGSVLSECSSGYAPGAVSDWTDIVQIACGDYHTVGLRADGTVLATGDNELGQCDVAGWTGITQIACGPDYTLGMREDGTVLCTRNDIVL